MARVTAGEPDKTPDNQSIKLIELGSFQTIHTSSIVNV